ncbi:MAG: c-type cytochrome [Pseudomonas sp.]
MKTVIASLLGSVVLVASLGAAAQVTPEDQIKFRKAGYSFMSWNMGKIKAQVIDGSVEYNQDQIAAAANTIAAIANSGMGALYGPGTEQNVGNQVTRVEPALFDNFPDVIELSGNFVRAADNLAEQAASGDQASIRTAFGELGQSCKACHDKYRKD